MEEGTIHHHSLDDMHILVQLSTVFYILIGNLSETIVAVTVQHSSPSLSQKLLKHATNEREILQTYYISCY